MNEERRTQSEHRSEVERAAEVMGAQAHNTRSHDLARALSSAGLLRTEADRLNAELAEAMVAYNKRCAPRAGATGHIDLSTEGPERNRVWSALRAILDARKPSPRWTVGVTHQAPTIFYDGSVYHVLPVGFEPEARAYVARKNAEGAK